MYSQVIANRPGETLDKVLQSLSELSNDCNFKAVPVEVHKEEAICDAFLYMAWNPTSFAKGF